MKKTEFRQAVQRKAVSMESYNSNNGWGFGGAYGKLYKLNDKVSVLFGTACYRHAPSHPVWKVFFEDRPSMYADTEPERKEVLDVFKELGIEL